MVNWVKPVGYTSRIGETYMNFIKREPAIILGVVLAVLNLVVTLGYLDASQGESLAAVAESILILLGSMAVRQHVTPVDKA